MEAVLAALSGVVVLCLAARTAWRAVDPPYRGVHVRGAGRHREREWDSGEYPLVKPSCDVDWSVRG